MILVIFFVQTQELPSLCQHGAQKTPPYRIFRGCFKIIFQVCFGGEVQALQTLKNQALLNS